MIAVIDQFRDAAHCSTMSGAETENNKLISVLVGTQTNCHSDSGRNRVGINQ